MNDEIRPFHIDVPQADVDDLKKRLAQTRWPEEQPDGGWAYGAPLAYVRELAEYWRTTYDWRKHEARLNEFPQFTTTLDGANVHFLHVRSPEPEALPLLITHGWPGSIVEYLELIGPLTDPRSHGGDPADAFHLVMPSIPGYGFSGPTHEKGWGMGRVAKAWAELMPRLGYDRYFAHGGDWGAGISRELGIIDAEHIAAVHMTMLTTPPPKDPAELAALTEEEKARLARLDIFRLDGMAYAMQQGTRPQTLSYGLTDSPAGQLAWIVEKFWEWTDHDKSPDDAVNRDQLLTNISIYWFTQTAGSSARLYYETAHSPRGWGAPPQVSTTPAGIAVFPREIAPPVRRIAEKTNNIVHWSEFDRGGHFAAMEEPDLLLADVREFVRRFR